jgi:hypothetical protein
VIRLKKGHLGIEQPARLQHAAALGYRLARVLDVLEQALKNDKVRRPVAKGQGERGSDHVGRPRIVYVDVDNSLTELCGPGPDIQDRGLRAGPAYKRLDAAMCAPRDQKRLGRRGKPCS